MPFSVRFKTFLCLCGITFSASIVSAQLITTVVGGGYASGQSAFNVGIGPQNTTLDAAGNLVVADYANSRVFKLDQATGIISVISGLGIIGNYGDGGPAAGACFYNANDVAYDKHGNLFVADFNNNKIRKIDTNGIITTYAGNGAFAFGGDGGPAVSASLNRPASVFVDSSDRLYIADEYNHRIRMVNASGIITTVAGNGTAGFGGDDSIATNAMLNYPSSVKQDRAGNLVIADQVNERLRRIDGAGIIRTIAGGGASALESIPATNASLSNPLVVTIDTSGAIVFSEYGTNRIRKVNTAGIISLVAGTGALGFSGDGGPATLAKLRRPAGVTADKNGNLFICDYDPASLSHTNCRIRKVAASGIISTIAGDSTTIYGGDGDPSLAAQIFNPGALAVDGKGAIYVIDSQVIVRKSGSTGIMSTFAGTHRLMPNADSIPATDARMNPIAGLVTDVHGNLYLADAQHGTIRKVDTNGIITRFAGGGSVLGDGGPATAATLSQPTGLAFDRDGNLYIADNGNYRVRKIDTTGVITTVAGMGIGGISGNEGPATTARISAYGVAVDDSGKIFISDNLFRIRMVDSAGIIHAYAGAGISVPVGDGGPATAARLNKPQGLATDHYGNLYVADFADNRVRRINSSGIISTMAGNGVAYYYGDGQDIAFSEVDGPSDIKVDADGNLLFTDKYNFRVRKVWLNTGVRDVAKAGIGDLIVTPNPAITVMDACAGENADILYWVLTNLRGEEVYAVRAQQMWHGKLHLDVRNYPNGMYILNAVGAGVHRCARVVIAHE